MSTSFARSGRCLSRDANARASWAPLCIFQLPATSIAPILGLRDRGDSRQLLALEQLERRAATRGDPGDALRQPFFLHRADRVPAADDRVAVEGGDRPG